MKIRAVTLGIDLPLPRVSREPFEVAADFLREAVLAFQDVGVEVQTTRIAGPSLGPTLESLAPDAFTAWAADVERATRDAGIGYVSLGLIPSTRFDLVERGVALILAAGQIAFLAADLVDGGLPQIAMARACARAVRDLAHQTPLGFGNLRFAALASCRPGIPFLPAAYHVGGQPRFSIAVEAADIALAALREEGSVGEIEDRLVRALEDAMAPVEATALLLEERLRAPFVGVDLSLAPFPADDVSIGGAIEAAGVDRFGAPGTLYVVALIMRAIRRTRVRRTGFSGLMLPVLEDSVLARRMAERPLNVHELLLYSAVCGTGLDTVPLPGDVTEDELAGIYLDVAALSIALGGKPLTARLLPVPGATAGAETHYEFDYFANSRVLPVSGAGAGGLLRRGGR